MQEFSFYNATTWLVVCTQESSFTLNYFVSGLYEGVQFYSLTKRLEASFKTAWFVVCTQESSVTMKQPIL
jgi:hypothetical protein